MRERIDTLQLEKELRNTLIDCMEEDEQEKPVRELVINTMFNAVYSTIHGWNSEDIPLETIASMVVNGLWKPADGAASVLTDTLKAMRTQYLKENASEEAIAQTIVRGMCP